MTATNEIQPAFHGELMLAGATWSHSQGAKVTFWLADHADLEIFQDMTIKKGGTAGQRFAAVLVEIGADEKPAPIGLASRCALQCKSLGFQQFVEQKTGFGFDTPEERTEQARQFVLDRCHIRSRSELDTNGQAALAWQQLLSDFRDWSRP